ncbi:hypothetical protein ALI144C_03605 [Actinosynnema sp. ALI-1.44]|nr:hypothetical protein ALI144C_03605 [Actinosynnema sp. ALI-1.44]
MTVKTRYDDIVHFNISVDLNEEFMHAARTSIPGSSLCSATTVSGCCFADARESRTTTGCSRSSAGKWNVRTRPSWQRWDLGRHR